MHRGGAFVEDEKLKKEGLPEKAKHWSHEP